MGGLTVVKNPFNSYDGRIHKAVPSGSTIASIIDEYSSPDFEVIVSLNGKVVTDFGVELTDQDSITIMARLKSGGEGESKGKTMLRIVAIIVVAIVSQGVGAYLYGAGTTAAGVFASVATIAGTLLVNALIPPPKPEVGSFENKQDSNLYGWGPKQNQFNEGQAAAVLFGKTKVYPQIIGNYREFLAYKDNLNILFHICDGKIDSVTDIKVNDIPLASLGDNASTTFLDGSINQTVPEKFNDTIYEKQISTELAEVSDEIIVTTDGTTVERLAVGIQVPNGLFSYIDGAYNELYLRYSIEYRAVGDVTWIPFLTNDPTPGLDMSTSGKSRSQLVWTNECEIVNGRERCERVRTTDIVADTFSETGFTLYADSPDTIRIVHEHFAALTPDQYEIKIVRLSKFDSLSGSVSRSNRLIIDFIQEKNLDDFNYPGRAVLAMNAIAQDKIYGGRPVFSLVAEKEYIEQYSGDWGVGSPTLRPGNSPAWACYEMLTHPLFGPGIHPDDIEIQNFIDWHTFCDSNSLEVNMYIGISANMFDSLRRVSFLGMGSIIQRGTKFGAVWDDASPMVHLFTMGNIIESTMKMSYIEKENRANAIEVTYYDEDIDYARKTLVQKSDETGDNVEERRAPIDMIGCTKRQQAIDYARFLLRSNEHLVRSVTFDASIDAVPVQPGDVFGLSHDIPLWGESGRTVSATSTTVDLDREVLMEAGESYNIIVRDDATDTFETQAIVNPESTGYYQSLTLTGTWTLTPPSSSLYSFGQVNSEVKLFRCISVTRSQDIIVTVSGLEYRSEIYVNDPSALPDYEQEAFVDQLVGLDVDDSYKILPDGAILGTLNLLWRGFSVYWDVRVSEKESGFSRPEWNTRVEQSHFDVVGIRSDVEYTVTVTSPNGTILTEDYTPIVDPPDYVRNLTAGQLDNFVTIDWEPGDSELPVYKYLIHKGSNYNSSVLIGEADKTFTTFYETASGLYTYWVTPVTESGLRGSADSVTIQVDTPPDFKAITDFCIDGSGTHTNTVWDGDKVVGPVDLTETWEEWWDSVWPPSASGITWQDWIDAGYDDYLELNENAPLTAQYEQTFDIGVEIVQAGISWEINRVDISDYGASVDLDTTVSYSQDDITYTTGQNTTIVKATDFRYVNVVSDFTSDGREVIGAKPCFQVTAKKIYEDGKNTVTNATLGKTITFDLDYSDVESIQITPISTAFRVGVYDFDDIPHPTDFTVFLFDEDGNKVTGNFAYTVTGI